MNTRPPYKRNSWKKKPPGTAAPTTTRGITRHSKLRRLGYLLALLALYSLFQLLNQGRISWPGQLLDSVGGTLEDYAARPEAGWRKATDAVENLGAAREGKPIPQFDFSGRVVRVADGDTVSILDRDKRQHKVRLFGIDTPERDQPHGDVARRALSKLVADKTVGVVVVDIDDYGRTVGTLYRDDTNVNLAMVAAGDAWWYRYYAPHERHLESAEHAARKQQLGLWAKSTPIPPWDWRRGRR